MVKRLQLARAIGIGLGLAGLGGPVAAKAQDLSPYQGAWLIGGDCAEIFTAMGKGTAFRKPLDIFAPAFIVTGNRLTTPQASCRIKSVRPSGDRQVMVLSCANAVSGGDVQVYMTPQPDGSLQRYFNAQDTIGSNYQRCSR